MYGNKNIFIRIECNRKYIIFLINHYCKVKLEKCLDNTQEIELKLIPNKEKICIFIASLEICLSTNVFLEGDVAVF